jgi:hypothetical protein
MQNLSTASFYKADPLARLLRDQVRLTPLKYENPRQSKGVD